MSPEHLREICALTLELTRLRQNECKHLCIENAAAEIFRKLLVVCAGNPAQFSPAQNPAFCYTL